MNAYVWLWKDHTGHAEAAEITATAQELRPEYLGKCGGVYSSEWFWSKILRCLHVDEAVFDAAATWVELADWMPGRADGDRPASAKSGAAFARPVTRRCSTKRGAAIRTRSSLRRSTRSWRASVPRCRIRRTMPPRQSGALTTGVGGTAGSAPRHPGRRRRLRRAPGRGRLRHRAGNARQDHRHLHVRPHGRTARTGPRGHPGSVRDRAGVGAAGAVRARGRAKSAVGDIFNWFVGTIKPEGKSHAELTDEAEQLRAWRERPARARLAQRQPDRARGPAADRD